MRDAEPARAVPGQQGLRTARPLSWPPPSVKAPGRWPAARADCGALRGEQHPGGTSTYLTAPERHKRGGGRWRKSKRRESKNESDVFATRTVTRLGSVCSSLVSSTRALSRPLLRQACSDRAWQAVPIICKLACLIWPALQIGRTLLRTVNIYHKFSIPLGYLISSNSGLDLCIYTK